MTSSGVDVRVLLKAAAANMWVVFDESSASSRPDQKGTPREQKIRQFLKERLPPKWGITKGHVIFSGDIASKEFDVLIYDAQNCPSWKLDAGDDPRRLVPIEALIGVIEVKSTLSASTLKDAIDKLIECESIFATSDHVSSYVPFRFVFSYRLDESDDFDGWGSPYRMLTRYAGAKTQPDGVFVLNSGFSILNSRQNVIARSHALFKGESVETVLSSSWDVQNEEVHRDIHSDPAYCYDYYATSAKDGFLLLAFLTFLLEYSAKYRSSESNYADVFSRWGGPMLSGVLDHAK